MHYELSWISTNLRNASVNIHCQYSDKAQKRMVLLNMAALADHTSKAYRVGDNEFCENQKILDDQNS